MSISVPHYSSICSIYPSVCYEDFRSTVALYQSTCLSSGKFIYHVCSEGRASVYPSVYRSRNEGRCGSCFPLWPVKYQTLSVFRSVMKCNSLKTPFHWSNWSHHSQGQGFDATLVVWKEILCNNFIASLRQRPHGNLTSKYHNFHTKLKKYSMNYYIFSS